jgi:hypothetical protein
MTRFLFATAAATLLAAAPAFAAEHPGAKKDACSCCSDGSMHQTDHAQRERGATTKDATSHAAQQPAGADDPYVRNQSFGG